MNVKHPVLAPVFGLLVLVLLLSSCKKNNDEIISQPAAGLMAFNLAIDKPAIGFTLSGNQLVTHGSR